MPRIRLEWLWLSMRPGSSAIRPPASSRRSTSTGPMLSRDPTASILPFRTSTTPLGRMVSRGSMVKTSAFSISRSPIGSELQLDDQPGGEGGGDPKRGLHLAGAAGDHLQHDMGDEGERDAERDRIAQR